MVYILSAKRTPIGVFGKTFMAENAVDLGSIAFKSAIDSANIVSEDIQDVIIGQVLTAGCGQNPARQTALKSGISKSVPAMTINQVCGSGLRAVILGSQIIKDGLECVLVGGQESMSFAHFSAYYNRKKKERDISKLKDTMLTDGLMCAIGGYHMGITAENLAEKFSIDRFEQDTYAFSSQQKTKKAQESGCFNAEIVPVGTVDKDMFPRPNTTIDSLRKLPPVFKKEKGTVSAGNSSGINDGSAGIVLASESFIQKKSLKPLAKIISYGISGVDPSIMGIGPVEAVHKALYQAGWNMEDLDLIEANEAFAVQSISVNKQLKWDINKVNVHGGAIALGHPIGASGSRILTTLVHALQRYNKKKGIATLCVGGGMGVAVCIERV